MSTNGPARLALVSLHTSPLDRPGEGDSGGMNVFVGRVASGLARRGVEVDVFTRCAGRGGPQVQEPEPGVRIVEVHAGPCEAVPKGELPEVVPAFSTEVLDLARREGSRYDVVQSHYWLSGLVGRTLSRRWEAPLVALFHTLARVKNLTTRPDEEPEPESRAAGEELVAGDAARVVVPTETEGRHLSSLYGVDADRIRLGPPGVDTTAFRPRDRADARRRVGLPVSGHVGLVAGRLQPLKGPDLAIRTVAEAARTAPAVVEDLSLVVAGGDGGGSEEIRRLSGLAASLGIAQRVRFLGPVAHEEMPWVYAASDVVLMPSRSESFGLVALEAQACGAPVIASDVGGLAHIVDEGNTGFLVPRGDVHAMAERLVSVLADTGLRDRLAAEAARSAARFSWDETVSRLLDVYAEVAPGAFPERGPSAPAQVVTLPPDGVSGL